MFIYLLALWPASKLPHVSSSYPWNFLGSSFALCLYLLLFCQSKSILQEEHVFNFHFIKIFTPELLVMRDALIYWIRYEYTL